MSTTFPKFPDQTGGRIHSQSGTSFPEEHPVPEVDGPIHVVPSDDGWIVRFEGTEVVAAVLPTKKEAMAQARTLAKARDLRLVEHGADGRIRS